MHQPQLLTDGQNVEVVLKGGRGAPMEVSVTARSSPSGDPEQRCLQYTSETAWDRSAED
jgi:hypothetical protein